MPNEILKVPFPIRKNVYRALLKKKTEEGLTWNSLFELLLLDAAASKKESARVIDALMDQDQVGYIARKMVK